MPKFIAQYSVVIYAEDEDEAALKADEIECGIQGLKYVREVSSDAYLEEFK